MTSLLAIDPGTVSGWSRLDGQRVVDSGTVRTDSARGLETARQIVASVPDGALVAVETLGYLPSGKARFDTAWGLGVHAGLWICLARCRGLEVRTVPPREWMQKMISIRGRLPRRSLGKELSRARARAILHRDVGPDEADALLIGVYCASLQNVPTFARQGQGATNPASDVST